MKSISHISAIITNHCTPHLLARAVESLRGFYPDISIVIVENGSPDASLNTIMGLKSEYGNIITSIEHPHNVGHGPAMHDAIMKSFFPYIFTLDTDCKVMKGGFLELMLEKFDYNPRLYAIGWLRWANEIGVSLVESETAKLTPETQRNYIPMIHPHAMLLDRRKYLTLLPFDYSGAPCFNNMRHAACRRYTVASFRIDDYVKHLGAGTRRMWNGAWDIGDIKPLKEWKERDIFPI